MPWGTYTKTKRRPRKQEQKPAPALGYSPRELADALGMHIQTIRRAYSSGKLQATRVGRTSIRITMEAVKKWMGEGNLSDGTVAPRDFFPGSKPQ
jgi:excisionase family DNA binding protein